MKKCDICETDFKCIENMFICENGHTFEYQVEMVQVDMGGRSVSTVQKIKNEKSECTAYQYLEVLFDVWKYYKLKFNFGAKIMKIYLSNIAFKENVIRKCKGFVKANLLVLILYLSLRIEKNKYGTYFFRDFLKDIENIEKFIIETRHKKGYSDPKNMFKLRRLSYGLLTLQVKKIDMSFKHNIYMFDLIEDHLIIWIKSLIRLINEFKEFYDFRKDVCICDEIIDCKEYDSKSKFYIEMLLSARKNGLEHSYLPRYRYKKEIDRLPILNELDFKVTLDKKLESTTMNLFIDDFIQQISRLQHGSKISRTLTTCFLKFIFRSNYSGTLYFYEIEICAFLYTHIYFNIPNPLNLSILDPMVKYLDCQRSELRAAIRKVSYLF